MSFMPLIKHYGEMRRRILVCLVAFVVAFILNAVFYRDLLRFFNSTISQDLAILTLTEGFSVTIKLISLSAVVIISPLILYQIWAFISSGLKQKEKSRLVLYVPLSFLLFIFGCLLALFYVAPLGVKFLMQFTQGFFVPVISAKAYLSFLLLFIVMFGLVFQLPLIVVFLNKSGLISKRDLRRRRAHFYLSAFVFGSIITPPDVITQISLAVPVIILYEVSILLSN